MTEAVGVRPGFRDALPNCRAVPVLVITAKFLTLARLIRNR